MANFQISKKERKGTRVFMPACQIIMFEIEEERRRGLENNWVETNSISTCYISNRQFSPFL